MRRAARPACSVPTLPPPSSRIDPNAERSKHHRAGRSRAAARATPQIAEKTTSIPGNSRNQSLSCDNRRSTRALSGRSAIGARPARHHLRRCASSSPAPAASSARCWSRGCAPTGTSVRALARDPRGSRGARRATADEARWPSSRWCAATRSPARGSTRALEGVEVAYYLIHSMERATRGCGAVRRARARRGRELRRGGGARRGAADRLPRRPAAARGELQRASAAQRRDAPTARALAPPRQPRGGRADPARGRARLGRAARVDRDRRALALVPPARSAGRAHAGAARCPRGSASARSRSTSAT